MSKVTIALEAAVASVLENMPKDGEQTRRQRANVDRAYADILKLIAPRIRHFIRQYGLTAHWEDAEQCCAIAVHRAIQAYDPSKAQFTTFINWQLRGELQSLRFRLMTDQRPSAKKVEATTVSLNALATSADGEEMSPETLIEDEFAEERTEAGASDFLADNAIDALVDAYVDHLRKVGMEQLRRRPRPKRRERVQNDGPRLRLATHGIDPEELEKLEAKLERDREIVARRVFEAATLDDLANDTGVTKERVRQITKRATKAMAELAATDPRFAVMAEYKTAAPARPKPRRAAEKQSAAPLLPNADNAHNRLTRVVAIDPAALPAEAAMHAGLEAGFSELFAAPAAATRH
ncbi:sigma factor-like helix-turn-helix DNA-binding protein [Stakelama tenebrarum]|uniref:Sigma-70 family RNA polymerase sigma factor n=1 Tax=Stakelama tenebrarum TaxID=2711215 RepID=A0A6G6Y490_9SPHN|nr:sigma factor-like helix-turn-helix DNA-binding protein [Sphingosinithalassobacter tenebrarum]QIG79661.1 sigma-70 family RNA polymerase sigma factor [Sphingosinithalassobacter tenebrarum]